MQKADFQTILNQKVTLAVIDPDDSGFSQKLESGMEKKGFSKTKEEMINFVKEINQRAKRQNGAALIFPQNAVELLGRSDYLAVIDGVGAEDTFYFNNRVASWSKWDIEWLDKAIKANKIVLAIDYSTKKELQCDFIKKAREHKFISFVSVRNLDRIIQVNCD